MVRVYPEGNFILVFDIGPENVVCKLRCSGSYRIRASPAALSRRIRHETKAKTGSALEVEQKHTCCWVVG